MQLSSAYNRFIHGVVYKELHSIQKPIKVFDGKFIFRPSGLTYNSVKQLLKHLDLNYPREGNKVKSITKLTTQEMSEHLEFITLLLGENGITQKHIEEEFKRLMEVHKIEYS